MKKKIQLTTLVLQMGDTRVEMSLEDAEELFGVLEKLFGKQVETKDVYVPYPVYPQRRSPYWWWDSGTYTIETPKWGNICLTKENSNFDISGSELRCDMKMKTSSAKLLG